MGSDDAPAPSRLAPAGGGARKGFRPWTLEPELENLRGADIGAPQEPIRAILHKLKSQVQTIGAADAHAMMSAHEQTIKGGGTISQSELDTTCDLLSTLIQNLQDLLK